ncbi:hypothetical protein BH09BAC2_BH09BAC2_19780 [soil metagenome]
MLIQKVTAEIHMIRLKTIIQKFNNQGEKTGWTYFRIPATSAQKLKPGNKKSFRVKGKLDDHEIKNVALLPMGEGDFIMALNADMRKHLRKTKGQELMITLEVDESGIQLNAELMECIAEEKEALDFFNSLAPGHQNYFSKWIDSAKTSATKAKRIAQTITAMYKHQDYGQMIREQTANNKLNKN